ncbi:MAG: two-component system response regulator [Proteobacteria bacterium SG_bin7]|nr:MAG: two-component system response regulator [Proteobacteria bacterium SG_bin7]
MTIKKSIPILVADDDQDDQLMIKEAMQESRLLNELFFVKDGEELMRYLERQGHYNDDKKFPMPGLILLDLNMPRKDGREALQEIKSNPGLRQIPVVILTTSKAEEDIFRSYNLGVNSFVTKPVQFASLVEVMKALGHYWFDIVRLPNKM